MGRVGPCQAILSEKCDVGAYGTRPRYALRNFAYSTERGETRRTRPLLDFSTVLCSSEEFAACSFIATSGDFAKMRHLRAHRSSPKLSEALRHKALPSFTLVGFDLSYQTFLRDQDGTAQPPPTTPLTCSPASVLYVHKWRYPLLNAPSR
jgi:hypothetical protein